MTKGRVSELDAELSDLLLKDWHPIKDAPMPERRVIAVDGSQAIRPLASGAFFYIARALALSGKERFRELEADCFFSRGKVRDVSVFVNRRMEWVEMKVAIKALKGLNEPNLALLMDGSLYGKLTHLPKDQPAEGMKGLMIEYFETLHELLELCRERGVLVLGVSKDSRSSFLRDKLLYTIFQREVKGSGLPATVKEELEGILEGVLDRPVEALDRFKGLKDTFGSGLEGVERILSEAMMARTDHQLILNFVEGPGYTTPIELSFSRRGQDRLRQIEADAREYARRYFGEALLEASDEETFLTRATEALSRIPEFPSMVSFHILLDVRDTPMRVDAPSWVFGMERRISDITSNKELQLDLSAIVGLLLKGYVGLRDYNVWLKRADEEVRLTRDIVDRLYASALEKVLGVTILHSRGYRRVRYP